MAEHWCKDILPSYEQPKHRRQNAQTMDLQKMTPCPLANCCTSTPRLVTDIQRICKPYKQKRTHKHPAVGGASRRQRDVVTMSCASQHKHSVLVSRGKDTDNTRSDHIKTFRKVRKDLLPYSTRLPPTFSYIPCHMASIYWGCKSQK